LSFYIDYSTFISIPTQRMAQGQAPPPKLIKMKDIIVLGGSYAGVSTAHRLLKQAGKMHAFKITMVSPNSDLYWNMASPRGVLPNQLKDEDLFQPIAAGFAQYPVGCFEFILGAAKAVDLEAKTVEVSGPDGHRSLGYDLLILATGSRTKDGSPFKALNSTEATKRAVHDMQIRIGKAQSIVIAGAGVTGIEIAGELGYRYGKEKQVVLVSLRKPPVCAIIVEAQEITDPSALADCKYLNAVE
jgi:apoptosis-inducing factor 2